MVAHVVTPLPPSPSPWLLTLLWDLVSPLHMRLLSLAWYTRGSFVCPFFVATLPTDPFIDPQAAAQMRIGVPSSEQADISKHHADHHHHHHYNTQIHKYINA